MKMVDYTSLSLGTRLAVVAAILPVAVPAMAQSPDSAQSWYGVYEHSESVSRSEGTAGSVDTRITLNDAGCRIDAEGVMTNTHILCNARMRGKSLAITFKSFAGGGLKNQYGVAQYRPGSTLLTLTRSPRGLITAWQGYTPSDGRPRTGKYFMKRPN